MAASVERYRNDPPVPPFAESDRTSWQFEARLAPKRSCTNSVPSTKIREAVLGHCEKYRPAPPYKRSL